MSWWDTSNFTKLASQALENAQKTIDKALDISEEEKGKAKAASKPASASKPKKKSEASGGEFWNSWLSSDQESTTESPSGEASKKETPTSPSSWSFGWGGQTEDAKEEETPSSWSSFDANKLGGGRTKKEKTKVKAESEAIVETQKETDDSAEKKKSTGALLLGQKKSSKSPRTSSSDIKEISPRTSSPDRETIDKPDSSASESMTQDFFEGPSLSQSFSKTDSVAEVKEIDSVPGSDNVAESGESQTTNVSLHSKETSVSSGTFTERTEVEEPEGIEEKTDMTSGLQGSADVLDSESVKRLSSDEETSPIEGSLGVSGSWQSAGSLFGAESPGAQNVKEDECSDMEVLGDSMTSSPSGSAQDRTECTELSAETNPLHNSEQCASDNSETVAKDITSSSQSIDATQGVTLDIPSDSTEQFQVGPSTPLSSEASIITLSSPGQDDLDTQDSPQSGLSSQQISSEYINISTTQLQTTSMDDVYIPESASAPSLASEESEQADSSLLEQEFLEKEQADLGQSSGNDSSDASKLDSSMDTCTSGETVVDPNQSVAKESDSENEHDEHDIEKSDESFPATSPNTSFVKNMLEEAMEDVAKPEDSGSDNHSGGDKSESSKVESEIDKSISGHESSDDIETTTSSDIEIISTPTPNGDKSDNPFDLSPLRIVLQKAASRRDREQSGHRRNDSQSSSSGYSKAGESDQMSPGRDSLERQDLESGDEELRAPDLSAVCEEDLDNPYHPQKLLQTASLDPQQLEVIKKLAGQAEVLQHRENKLVQMSKENNELLETNSILRNQLQQLEELRETEMTDLNILTDEFTKRLSEAEKKLQASIKEKEAVKRQLQTAQEELRKSANDISQERLMAEKDEQITELLQEGEKLSKQILQSNNIIKKLRTKEKENESVLTSNKKKLEEQKTELEHLRKVCEAKDDMEKKQTEAIHQLNAAVQKQEKEILKYKGEHDESDEKLRSLQVTLDNAYKEIADLHKMNAAQGSKAQEAALSAEVAVREQLKVEMEQEGQRFRQERETLIMQIEDLRLSMSRMEKDHNRREDMLRQEISDLQLQLQEDEARNQELTHSVTSATRPLLRQIENLQSNYSAQSTSWEKVEKNLTERLGEAQSQLAMAVEKERSASEKLMDQSIRVTTLESQIARLRQEKSQLLAQGEMDKAKIELLEEAKLNEMAQIDVVKKKMTKELTELKKDKVFLETQVETETAKLETEKKKVYMLEEQIKMMDRERPKSRGTPSPVSVSRQESYSSFQNPELLPVLPQEDLLERTLMLASPNGSKMNLYESLRQSGAATILESLQSQLKQREGEITQLQSEIATLERTRESMAKELVNLTNQKEELEEQAQEVPLLQEKYTDLDSRYNALLQMYGEKVEQAEELKLDLQDVKDMYKAQIDQLLTQ